MTVGMALLPFSLLADDELCLGGISEDCVIVADYDPLQLQSLRVLVEMVRSIDSGDSSSAAIRGPGGRVVDWWLPPPKRLRELALTRGWDLERLRSGCLKFEEHVRLRLVDGAIFIVDRRAPRASVDAAIAAGANEMRATLAGESRGVWENCLYDALEREGAVRIGTLCQFLDFFHFAFGRSVASMFDATHAFLGRAMARLAELQERLRREPFIYLHLNLITDAAALVAALRRARVCVTRVNISNVMDYVDGPVQRAQIAGLQGLQHVCERGCPTTLFLEAHVGGGIKTSLCFQAADWPAYVEAVGVWDALSEERAHGRGEGESARDLERRYSSYLVDLRAKCVECVGPGFVFY